MIKAFILLKNSGFDFAENGRGPLQHCGIVFKGNSDKLLIIISR